MDAFPSEPPASRAGFELVKNDQREPCGKIDRGDIGAGLVEPVQLRIECEVGVLEILDEVDDEIDEQDGVNGPFDRLPPGVH